MNRSKFNKNLKKATITGAIGLGMFTLANVAKTASVSANEIPKAKVEQIYKSDANSWGLHLNQIPHHLLIEDASEADTLHTTDPTTGTSWGDPINHNIIQQHANNGWVDNSPAMNAENFDDLADDYVQNKKSSSNATKDPVLQSMLNDDDDNNVSQDIDTNSLSSSTNDYHNSILNPENAKRADSWMNHSRHYKVNHHSKRNYHYNNHKYSARKLINKVHKHLKKRTYKFRGKTYRKYKSYQNAKRNWSKQRNRRNKRSNKNKQLKYDIKHNGKYGYMIKYYEQQSRMSRKQSIKKARALNREYHHLVHTEGKAEALDDMTEIVSETY